MSLRDIRSRLRRLERAAPDASQETPPVLTWDELLAREPNDPGTIRIDWDSLATSAAPPRDPVTVATPRNSPVGSTALRLAAALGVSTADIGIP